MNVVGAWLTRRLRAARRRHAGQRGAAMVELAMALPVMLILLAGIVEVGDGLNSYISVVAATRDGARLGSRGAADNAAVRALVLTNLGRLRDTTAPGDVVVTRNVVPGQDSIRVQACNNHKLIMSYPLLPLPNPMKICASTTMRILKIEP